VARHTGSKYMPDKEDFEDLDAQDQPYETRDVLDLERPRNWTGQDEARWMYNENAKGEVPIEARRSF